MLYRCCPLSWKPRILIHYKTTKYVSKIGADHKEIFDYIGIKGTAMQIEKAVIKDRLCVSKVS